ncbi:6959_t:CDS:2 [Dentiscutata erythropus]|uniref:6959_t:CDS:1 n=1 Tax=Dentiscutata erythropus TaxID=1348616 RepID=A0A9N9FF36_9GLOM|nr:6959_t:CDS:2 [Dentiscutata erythropus]
MAHMVLSLITDPLRTVFAINVMVIIFRFTLARVKIVKLNVLLILENVLNNSISSGKSSINNSVNSISSEKSLINNFENSISSEKSLINKSSDFAIDKDLPEIWNNFWSKFLG